MTNKKLPDNFCVLPWVGIHARTMPIIAPCCDFSFSKDDFHGSNVKDYQKSQELKNLKDAFLKGKWHEGCWMCQQREERSGMSMRMIENGNFKNFINKDEIELEDVEQHEHKYFNVNLAISNTCNLGCVMCSPNNSSYLYHETELYKDEHFLNIKNKSLKKTSTLEVKKVDYKTPNPFKGNFSNKDIDDLVDSFADDGCCPARMQVHGGEPTVMKEVYYLIDKLLEKGLNEKIQFEFNSNFQQYNPKFFKKLETFRGHALISLDAVGKQQEYIRYPSNWKNIKANIKRFKEENGDRFRITVCPTWQILNIFYFDKIVDFCNELGLNMYCTSKLLDPTPLAMNNLPADAKDRVAKIIRKAEYNPDKYTLDQRENIINYLYSDPIDSLESTVKYLEQVDKIRQLDWKRTFPELYFITKKLDV